MVKARHRVARFVLRHRWLSALLVLLGSFFFAAGLPSVELRTIFSDLLPKNHPFVQVYKAHPNFGNPLTVTIMVRRKDGDIYNPETLAKIWRMTRDVDLTPSVDHDQILSIASEKARYAEATPDGVDIRPLMDDAPPSTSEEVAEFRNRVNKAPNVRRFLISEDGRSTLIRATLIERLLDYGETFRYLRQLVERERDAHHDVFMAGQPVLTGWVYHHEAQMLSIFALTITILFLLLVFYARNVVGVVAPLVASAMAAVWGFGLVGWLNKPVEPLIMVVPLLLIARSFSHCVQVVERYFEIYAYCRDREKAAEVALGVMMPPGIVGIVTDAAGLFLIAVAPIPAMERLALFCGFWALALIPTTVFFVPLLLSWLPTPRNVDKLVGAEDFQSARGHIRGLLGRISRLSFGRLGRYTLGVLVILTVASLLEVRHMKVGNPVEGSNILRRESPYNIAVRNINDNFPGLDTLEIILEAKSIDIESRVVRKADSIFTMNRIQRFVEGLSKPPEATLSFADYLPEAARLFSGGNPKWAPLDPNDRAVEAAVAALMVGTSPKAFSHVTDYEQQNATVSLWYKDNRQETVDRAIAQAKKALALVGEAHESFRVRLASGTLALQQAINDTVDRYEYTIVGLLNLVIFFTSSFAYRSFVAGILLLVPVNLANLFLGAIMVLLGVGLDVNTLPIASIGIGVGIDYGIYLLSRICEEYQEYGSYEMTIVQSVQTTGRAIFFTAIMILVGIFPWIVLSELKFLADMGKFLVMVMLINMINALIIVPLLVWLFKPRFIRSGNLRVGERLNLSALGSRAS